MDVSQSIWIALRYFLNEWSTEILDPLQINRSAHCRLFLVKRERKSVLFFPPDVSQHEFFC